MAGSVVISVLSKKYAKLLGEFEFAEREVGDAFGLQAIIAATERSDQRKREIEEQLQAIETVIWLFEPDWDPAMVKPNYPRQKSMGEISLAAYGILRRAGEAMTTRELAKAVASALGYKEPEERDLTRIDRAIHASLMNKVGKTIEIASQNPIRWALVARNQIAAQAPRRSRRGMNPANDATTKGNEPNQQWESGDRPGNRFKRDGSG